MPSREHSISPPSEPSKTDMSAGKSGPEGDQHELQDVKPQLPIEQDLMGLARLGELRSIQKLFDSGKYNAKSADEQGITALHWAAINGHHALCHFLLQSGADVNAKGGDAQATPVLWASKKCNLDVVNLLLQNGADPLVTDDSGYNLLHCATLDGNVFQLILLLHQPDIPVDIQDSQGHTSLMWAAYKGYPACVDVLLRWGANVNAKDQMGFTALHWALVKGSYGCIQKLVEYGADRFVANNDGKTPAVTAQEMNSSKQWRKALSDSGFDAAGNPKDFPIPGIKDVRQFVVRAFFVWPFFILGLSIYVASIFPVYIGLPLALLLAYGMQTACALLLKWAPSDMKHIHKTPFLAGIFSATLAWTGIEWITKVLPGTWSSYFFSNLLFAIAYGSTAYFYTKTMLMDPGFIPKSGSRGLSKTVIEELISDAVFDEKHFCSSCMIRKPLRSKHCKRCNRCVAREDHHCPWVDNCVAINNHRHFIIYIASMMIGIALIIRLTIAYITDLPTPPESSQHCALLKPELCGEFSKDPFAILVAFWAALQLLWTTMLIFVQLTQVARAMTTYESMRGQHGAHATGPVATAIATGSLTAEGGAVDASGAGPDPAAASTAPHTHHHQKEGCFGQWTKLLGLDTFFMIAMHGSKADEVRARRKQNPFTRGIMRNCQDFWCDAGGAASLVSSSARESGVGLLGGEVVDYKSLYKVPAAGMRYRTGGYESVPVAADDEV